MTEPTNTMNNTWGMAPAINQMFGQGPPQYYQGNTVAGFTPMQQQAWGSGMQGANASQKFGQQMGDQFQQWGSNPGQFEQSRDWYNNPHLTNSIQAGMQQNNQNFERNVMPGITNQGIGAGQMGSSRQGIAQGMAMGDLNQMNLNMASQMQNQSYQQANQSYLQDQQNQLGARSSYYNAMPNMYNMYNQSQMQPAQMQSMIGGQQQGMNQSYIDADMARWNFNQNAPYQHMERYGNMMGGILGQYGETS